MDARSWLIALFRQHGRSSAPIRRIVATRPLTMPCPRGQDHGWRQRPVPCRSVTDGRTGGGRSDMRRLRTQVVIVGAGPSGLLLVTPALSAGRGLDRGRAAQPGVRRAAGPGRAARTGHRRSAPRGRAGRPAGSRRAGARGLRAAVRREPVPPALHRTDRVDHVHVRAAGGGQGSDQGAGGRRRPAVLRRRRRRAAAMWKPTHRG